MSQNTEPTYAGITRTEIVSNLQRLMNFIEALPTESPALRKAAAQMELRGGYIDKIEAATTPAELKSAIRNLSLSTEYEVPPYAGRAIDLVLETYASLCVVDDDPLCVEAFIIIDDWRKWGGMPMAGQHTVSDEDRDSHEIYGLKKDLTIQAQEQAMLVVLPAYQPQLQWEYYVHPAKGVTRNDLADAIEKSFTNIFNNVSSPLSSEVPEDHHQRDGAISRIKGSDDVIKAVSADLVKAGLVRDEDSFELAGTPAQRRGGYSNEWANLLMLGMMRR